MHPKWIGLLVFIFVLAAIVGSVSEGQSLLGVNQTTTLKGLTSWARVFSEEEFGMWESIGTIPEFYTSLFALITLDFPLFEGPWEIIRWIVLAPIYTTVVIGLVLAFLSIFRRTV